jgi:hypothetical protein
MASSNKTKYLRILFLLHILKSPSSYMTLQPLPSEFPYAVYEENCILFFISVVYLEDHYQKFHRFKGRYAQRGERIRERKGR